MIPLSVAEIARITQARPDQVTDLDAVVRGPVVIDSRRVQPGSLFAALPGERADGHDFTGAARAAGAVAVLASRPVGVPALIVPDVAAALARLARHVAERLSAGGHARESAAGEDAAGEDAAGAGPPTPGLAIIGITGSAGKTTTKDLTAQLVERLGPTVAPEGSFNNELGHPLTVLRADERTRYLVLELSARGLGHIAALCAIAPPRLGAVLNVGRAHLGEFRTREAIAEAKGELVESLPPDGTAVLNADDPLTAEMARRTQARVVTVGRSAGADIRAEDIRTGPDGRPAFTLVATSGGGTARAPVRLNFTGEHNVSNALAAAALAAELGMDTAAIAAGLSQAAPRSKWRMEVTERPDGVTVINDAYNASPEAMASALRTLAAMAHGGPADQSAGPRRSFAVLGCMAELGEHSAELHREAGALAARAGVTGMIVVGDPAAAMVDGAKSQPQWHGDLMHVPDAAAAVEALSQRLGPGDVVLVKASRAAGLERVALALLDGGAT